MPPSSTSPAYLSNLTPLRGIAALIVLFFHFDLFWGGPFNGTLFPTEATLFVKKGYLLVDFFSFSAASSCATFTAGSLRIRFGSPRSGNS